MVGGLQAARSPVAPGPGLRAGQRGPAAAGPGAGPPPAGGWSSPRPGSRRERPADRRRSCRRAAGAAVAQPADHRELDACGRRSTAAWPPDCPRSACGASSWPRPARRTPFAGWPTPVCGCPRSAAAGSSPPRTRPRSRPRTPRTCRALDEAAAIGRRRCAWCRAGCPPATAISPAARRRAADGDRASWCRTRAGAGCPLGIEPMHPIYAADRGVVSTLGQALDIAEPYPADGGRRRARHLPRLVGPRSADADRPGRRGAGSTATRCATGSRRCRPTPCWPAG